MMPDGKYIVRFLSEENVTNEFILATFEITCGEHKGRQLFMKFDSNKAKEISREYTGMWLSRLAFEGDKKAYALQGIIGCDFNRSQELIVKVKDGSIIAIPGQYSDTVERFKKTLAKTMSG